MFFRIQYDREEVARVDCIVHPLVAAVMFEPHDIRYRPSNGWPVRWSMPFNLAVALADRTVTVDSYTASAPMILLRAI